MMWTPEKPVSINDGRGGGSLAGGIARELSSHGADAVRLGGLPPRASLVEVVSEFGRFRLPMGFLGNWFVGRDQAVAYDDGLRLFHMPLEFRFTMPGGTMNDNSPWDTTSYNVTTGEPDLDRYVVWLDKMERPDLARFVPSEASAISRLPPDKLVNLPQYDSEGKVIDKYHNYEGMTFVEPSHEHVGFILDCSNVNCGGMIYFGNRKLTMNVLFPSDRTSDVFVICNKASELLAFWIDNSAEAISDTTKK